MGDGMEQVHIQPFVSGGPVESLDVDVLCWLAGLDIQHGDRAFPWLRQYLVRGRRHAQHFRPLLLEARPGLDTEIQL